MSARAPEEHLDTTGLSCPLPVLRMEARLRRLPAGAALRVSADDPLAAIDIPLFAREAGWRAERLPDEGGTCVFLVTRGRNPPD